VAGRYGDSPLGYQVPRGASHRVSWPVTSAT
jgi:hypothetical protein